MPQPVVAYPERVHKPGARKSVTERTKQLSDAQRRHLHVLSGPYPEGIERPKTRGDCLPGGCNEERPCPFVSCKHHLYLDVQPSGNVKFNFPDVDVDAMKHSCSLDVAEKGGVTLMGVGKYLPMTRERVRQIEMKIYERIRKRDLMKEYER